MDKKGRIKRMNNKSESGAALATVLLVTILLTTAIIALLSAAANHSKNVTDALSETKAYYAAESGLQATINVLRNSGITYTQADQNPTLSGANWLTYNYPTTGTATRVVIDNGNGAGTYNPKVGTAYSIFVEDPDNSSDVMSYNTSGVFESYTDTSNNTKAGFSPNYKTIYICANSVTTCDNTVSTRTELSITDQGVTTVDFRTPITSSSPLGGFNIVQNAVNFGGTIKFRNNYGITYPRNAIRNIHGSITKPGNFVAVFDSQIYQVIGNQFELCSASNLTAPCTDVTLNWSSGSTSYYGYFTDPVEPYRLRVVSIGYGPNGAKKQLEAFIQKDLLNGFTSPAPLMMQGPNAVFNIGNSNVTISGGDIATGTGIKIPSIGVVDSTSLQNLTIAISKPQNFTPAPAIVTDIPDWMATPQNLDAIVSQFRNTSINSGRYFSANNQFNSNQNKIGDFSNGAPTGTGITFYDGDFTLGNNIDGGGILVVTGKLTTGNNFNFKGLILITGAGGWARDNPGTITGNVVIAPYNSSNLVSNTFTLPPKYELQSNGGGNNSINYDTVSLDSAFTGTKAVSNFVLGVAEK